ncbi:MAG: hypothetical protein IPH12_05170 [Saprospirales bacterium]|nr:hypothetical protein [Saprospirales bacterium]MBK8923007.1 hypothetical protein [Saprospirales bacterium]
MGHQPTALQFSDYLFWDVEKNKIDFDKSKAYVIERVLSHGLLADWYALKACYGKETIREVVLNLRHLDKYALHFCAAYFNEPLERFRCYTYALSIPVHWEY